ncbi:MAG: carboxymuconolactone decarboxylase family protein [Pseudonocardiales bacterium]|nr:carboxymuconolactone decarboxylase family protein [Pseudonocardiales bacterium]
MSARMTNPAMLLPDVMGAIGVLNKAIHSGGVPPETLELVHLRASQINGCGACVDMGARAATKAGETPERLWSVVAWREAPYYSDAERAALALTEAATRLADRPDAVPDAIWDDAADHYDERGLAAIILMIAMTNFFNRINVTLKEPAGTTWG